MNRDTTKRATAGLIARLLAQAGMAPPRPSGQRAVAALAAAFVAFGAVGFPALVGYRCLVTDTVHDRPCCEHVAPLADAGSDRLTGICCELELRDATPVPATWSPASDLVAPPALLPSRAAILAVAGIALPNGVQSDGPPPGPPLHIRDCSLLI